jgi:hypothetical protein
LFSLVSLLLLLAIFAGGLGNLMIPIFALLNGLIAMGVGDVVIDANHRQRMERLKKE